MCANLCVYLPPPRPHLPHVGSFSLSGALYYWHILTPSPPPHLAHTHQLVTGGTQQVAPATPAQAKRRSTPTADEVGNHKIFLYAPQCYKTQQMLLINHLYAILFTRGTSCFHNVVMCGYSRVHSGRLFDAVLARRLRPGLAAVPFHHRHRHPPPPRPQGWTSLACLRACVCACVGPRALARTCTCVLVCFRAYLCLCLCARARACVCEPI